MSLLLFDVWEQTFNHYGLGKEKASCQMIYLLWSNDEKNTTKKYFPK